MIHYYIKRKLVASPVKTLCSGVWVVRAPVPNLRLSEISCPDCLRILIELQKKRLALFEANLAKAIEVVAS